jgi:hypothetical protein
MGPKRFKHEEEENEADMEGNFLTSVYTISFTFLEASDESSSGDEEMDEEDDVTNDDQPENAEKMNFDFEAIPPEPEDINQIGNLLTQVIQLLFWTN